MGRVKRLFLPLLLLCIAPGMACDRPGGEGTVEPRPPAQRLYHEATVVQGPASGTVMHAMVEDVVIEESRTLRRTDDLWTTEAADAMAVRVAWHVELVPHAGGRTGVALSAELQARRRGALPAPPTAVVTFLLEDREDEVRRERIREQARAVVHRLDGQARIRLGDDATVLDAVGSSDRVLRGVAVDEVRERRLRDAIPSLADRLRALDVEAEPGDAAELLAILGALVSLGATDVAADVIAVLPVSDPALLQSAIPGLARLGGPEVGAFLQVLATGHDSALVRELARTRLSDMR
ncbi:MAG: hypothetical protein EA398_02830 [Deltaproteobacteria bacterium]|nr:MAG: hypothetical protein EA398_02830 [Deltaproteobacteria bacterium]